MSDDRCSNLNVFFVKQHKAATCAADRGDRRAGVAVDLAAAVVIEGIISFRVKWLNSSLKALARDVKVAWALMRFMSLLEVVSGRQ